MAIHTRVQRSVGWNTSDRAKECSTPCTVIDEIGRDELNKTLINNNQRLTNDEPEWLCCGAMHVTYFLARHGGEPASTDARTNTTKFCDLRHADRALRPSQLQHPADHRAPQTHLRISHSCASSTHETLKSFARALFVTFMICSGSMTLDV